MLEKLYYSDDDIQVTNGQIVVQGKAYQTADISNVKALLVRIDLGVSLVVILLMFCAFACAFLEWGRHTILSLDSVQDTVLSFAGVLLSAAIIVLVFGRFLERWLKRWYVFAIILYGSFGQIEIIRSSDVLRVSKIVRAIKVATGQR